MGDWSKCVCISERQWEQTLVKSYFVFPSLAIATIFFDKAVQRCQIWQCWFIFTTFAVISIFFLWFCPPAFSLLPHSHLISPLLFLSPFLVLPPSGFFIVTLSSFKCHTHFVNGASVVAGNREDPVLLLARQQGTRVFSVSSCFWSSTDWFLSLLQKRLAHRSNKFSMSFWPVFNRPASARTEMGSNLMLPVQPSLSLFIEKTVSPFAFPPLFPSLLLWFLSATSLSSHYSSLARIFLGP